MSRVHFVGQAQVSYRSICDVAESVFAKLVEGGVEFDAEILGFDVARPVKLEVEPVACVERPIQAAIIPVTVCDAEHPHAFPRFEGEFEIVTLGRREVEIALEGAYHAPAGPAGAAVDAVALHRIADDSLRHFFDEVVGRLTKEARARDSMGGVPI